jgi:hypothetical protein
MKEDTPKLQLPGPCAVQCTHDGSLLHTTGRSGDHMCTRRTPLCRQPLGTCKRAASTPKLPQQMCPAADGHSAMPCTAVQCRHHASPLQPFSFFPGAQPLTHTAQADSTAQHCTTRNYVSCPPLCYFQTRTLSRCVMVTIAPPCDTYTA